MQRLDGWLGAGRPLPASAASGFDFAGPPQWFPARETRPEEDQRVVDEALSWAARAGQIESMDRLVRAGADVKNFGATPLDWARHGQATVAIAILEAHQSPPPRLPP